MSASPAPETIRVTGITNREFLDRFAREGRVGLSGGRMLIDRAIYRAQRHVDEAHQWSRWSHAFLFQGRRTDGHHWVIESDLQFHRRHIQLGAQENRLTKYHDEELYTTLAVLDLGLTPQQELALVREGLELVADRTRYSIRELFGTLIAMRHPKLRGKDNMLARDRALFCSALVQHVFRKAGLDLVPSLDVKNTTPEDLARSPRVRTMYLLERTQEPARLELVEKKLRSMKIKVRAAKARLKRSQ
ncbi:MAG TPA: hypothetical protein VI454_11135 [Verrucomicrobiae bacterium]|jgi:hypothetical protein